MQQVWNPYLVKDINSLERVQKFALRICSKNSHETYQSLHNLFQVPTLQNRRLFLCLCTVYSIVNELVFFPEAVLPSTMPVTSSRCRNYNTYAYLVPHAHLNGLKFSFFTNTARVWNTLPHEALNTTDLAKFKYLNHLYLCMLNLTMLDALFVLAMLFSVSMLTLQHLLQKSNSISTG